MTNNNLISINQMSKSFYSSEIKTVAVNQVDFFVNKSDFVSIEGRSGSGKSTFLSLLALLDSADSGKYELSGRDISNLSFSQKTQVRNRYFGIIFQSFNLIGELNVFNNVALPLKYNKRINKSEIPKVVDNALERVEMFHRKKHMPNELSGGEQQRVAIARSLVNSPELILADEPTGNLDAENSNNIMNILCSLNKNDGVTIVLITHDHQQANLGNVKYQMLDGQLTKQ
ncbi:ABC transporter ATP-binding protein [Aliikangiella sp. IMCC44359]|uniref:ABC transporter ATP-binding protein n=1 Tax=Aliikangiella sp. IMCC44359 TaxID=3459125 RepID=UPI00403B0CCC